MTTPARTWLRNGAIGMAGLAAGGILATTVAATAEDTASGDTAAQTDRHGPGEELLTGDTAESVRATRPSRNTQMRPWSGWRPTPTASTRPTS